MNGLATLARMLPPSRAKVRSGRFVAIVVAGLGLDPRTITTLPDGSRMLLDPRGRTEASAFWNGAYEPDYVKILSDLASTQDGPVVYDIGANIGLVTVPVAMAVRRRSGRVVCFEPVRENYTRLIENVGLNDLTATCSVYPLGLAASERHATMEREASFGATTGNAFLGAGGQHGRGMVTTIVELARLDDVVRCADLPLPTVLKLDVEGAEVGFLAGAQETLDQARPIILGEFNSGLMPRFGHTFLDAVALLPHGYSIFSFASRDTIVEKPPSVGLGDVLLVPQEKCSLLPLRQLPR
jgi:FkbM family methyltransferase